MNIKKKIQFFLEMINAFKRWRLVKSEIKHHNKTFCGSAKKLY